MKFILSIFLFVFGTTTVFGQNFDKYAKKARKNFDVTDAEIYTIDRATFYRHYGIVDTEKYGDSLYHVSFPENYLYNKEGKQIYIQFLAKGTTYMPLACNETYDSDLVKLFEHSNKEEVPKVIDSLNMDWVKSNVSPLYGDNRDDVADYHLYVYFPAGMSLLFKRFYPYYEELIIKVRHYQSIGTDIKLYFILMPVKG